MSREQRRRLLLRAHAAAARFCKKVEADPYFRPATDAFVAGWLLGYRAHRRDVTFTIEMHGSAGGGGNTAGGSNTTTYPHGHFFRDGQCIKCGALEVRNENTD